MVERSSFGSTPPRRASHELAELQQEILEVLAVIGAAPSTRIRAHQAADIPENTLLNNLRILQHLKLVEKAGRMRDARWMLPGMRSREEAGGIRCAREAVAQLRPVAANGYPKRSRASAAASPRSCCSSRRWTRGMGGSKQER